MSRGDLKTPYTDAVADTPSGASSGGGTSGGYDLDGGRKETENLSALPPLQTTVSPGEGDPGPNTQVPWPPLTGMHSIPTKGVGTGD